MESIRVQLFGAFRKYGNGDAIEVQISPNATVADVKVAIALHLKTMHPDFIEENLLSVSALADDQGILPSSASLEGRATFAILPPVCGG